jgi:co-chaperonin GroES (HSP10)
MSYKLEPLGSRVLVRLKPQSGYSGLIIRVARNESAREAEVIAIGPQVRDAKAGQTVLINSLAGSVVGDEILLPESAIMAYIVEGKNGDI